MVDVRNSILAGRAEPLLSENSIETVRLTHMTHEKVQQLYLVAIKIQKKIKTTK